MKLFSIATLPLTLALLAVSAPFVSPLALAHPGGELDLEMTGPEYRALFEQRLWSDDSLDATAAGLQDILEYGKRNLDWLEAVNGARPSDRQLALSDASTQRGIPIDAPRESNDTIVRGELEALRLATPASFWKTIEGSGAAPATIPADMTDETYLDATRKLDRVYQSASRWTLQAPSLFAYAARAVGDIRGYYFLAREADLAGKLNGFAQLSVADQARLRPLLIGVCRNSNRSVSQCSGDLDTAIRQKTVKQYYDRYLPRSKTVFDGYFVLQGARRDVQWTSANPNSFVLPFITPDNLEVRDWLRDNIQDEWRLNGWQLTLGFRPGSSWDSSTAHVVFEEGTTPHVNGLGGSEITMDANRSIQEYTSRWTIRHEFGHVLGLPDCYIEFYDTDRRVMINYQIDTSNLMCSRTGKLQPKHVEELKRVYYRD